MARFNGNKNRDAKASRPATDDSICASARRGRLFAYMEGQEAVRRKPHNSPENPYDADKEPGKYAAWEEGATAAGWNEIYYNGVLKQSER